MKDSYQFINQYTNNEPEAITIILQCIPDHFKIYHVFGHQDDKTKRKDLSIYANLNIDADHLATTSATIPINTHVSSMPFAVYVKAKYIHNKVDHHIRQHSHANEARKFLMQKYQWSKKKKKKKLENLFYPILCNEFEGIYRTRIHLCDG